MSNLKRIGLMVIMVMVVGVAAACGNNDGGGGGTGAGPEVAAKAWIEGAFNGNVEAVQAVTCAAQADQVGPVVEGLSSVTSAASAAGVEATLDLSGLTYTISDQTDTTATATVGGNLKVTVAGVDTEQPMDGFPPFPMVKEGDAWKLCPPDA
jgi:hypothetical protein